LQEGPLPIAVPDTQDVIWIDNHTPGKQIF